MRWIPFIILLYVAAVAQTTIAPVVEINTIRPDVLVVVAVYYALFAPRYDALLACWFAGFLIDLTSIGYATHSNVGVHAISLGFVGILIVGLRDYTNQDSPFIQMLYCMVAKLSMAAVAVFHMAYVLGDEAPWTRFIAPGVWEAVYTGLLAPYAFWVLRRFRASLGLAQGRRLRMG